jgi:hypothetical protein
MAIENFAGMGPDGSPSSGPPVYAYTILYDYDGSGNLIYIGWALSSPKPGPDSEWPAQTSAIPVTGPVTSGAYWAIKKLTYSAGGQVTKVQWANGNTQQGAIWDNRATTVAYQ